MNGSEFVIVLCIFLAGGVIKGALGIGLPAFLVGCLTFFYEPRVAVAMILFVIATTNFRQAWIGGNPWHIIRRHPYFCVCTVISIFSIALIGSKVPLPVLQIVVGLSMVLFALNSLFITVPALNPKYDKGAQIAAGIGSGILGGLTAIWSPPLAIYLMSLKLDKDLLIQTLGVMFSIQAIFLTAGFILSGELTLQLAGIGALMLVPAFAGMYFGEKIRRRMNMVQFMQAFLVTFLILGLNLIRRGVVEL